MKKIVAIAIAALLTNGCAQTMKTEPKASVSAVKAKNIIMVVADGMGPAYTTAYRYYNDNPATPAVEETVFERHLVGMSSTYPAPVSGYVTDSAAGATALASGVKTYNGAIGVNVDKQPVPSVLHKAKSLGMKTGVVATSQINHATPASYLTHNESRRNYNAIADAYIDGGIKADVYLGGGWRYYIRDDRNLVDEFKQAGFTYVDTYKQLAEAPKDTQLIGLFDDIGLPWALDDSNKHRLSFMTEAAITRLENDKGFFLLVEASQVDWAGHSNDIAAAMAEMDDLAKTMLLLETYVKNNPDTLVVLTADHSTGGLTLAANGDYKWEPELLKTLKRSPQKIAEQLAEQEITQDLVSEVMSFDVTEEEVNALKAVKKEAKATLQTYLGLSEQEQKGQRKPKVEYALYSGVNKLIDARTTTGWTSGGHTAIDVPVIALGAQKETFEGGIDNTDIANKIFSLLAQ